MERSIQSQDEETAKLRAEVSAFKAGIVSGLCDNAAAFEENLKLRAQNAELLAALEGSLGIVQASIVNARTRNEYPAIIANMEMKEAAMRAAISPQAFYRQRAD